MAKFSLLTVLLLYLGMLYFGREAGLPDKRIGRETSLWAELFGGGGDSGPLALLTQPAATPAPEPAPEIVPEIAPVPAAEPAQEPVTEPASDISAEPQEPGEALAVTDEGAVAAPGAGPGARNEPEPDAERIAGSDRAPARSLRPLARPERPVALAEAGAAPAGSGSTDTGSTDTGSTATGQTAAEPGPLEGTLEQVLEDVLAADDTPPVEGVLDTADPESLLAEAPDATSEPETDVVAATTFAPETTPRPLARPEPPAVPETAVPETAVPVAAGPAASGPVAAIEPDTAPLAEIAPASEALQEAPTSEVAALAAAALEDLPVAEPDAVILPEPVAEPAPQAAAAPETVETVEAAPEAPLATETVAEEATAAPENVPGLAETDPTRDLPSNLRPQPRPLQAPGPVVAEELSQPAPALLAAPETEILPAEGPLEGPVTEVLPEETGAEGGAAIVAAPLPEPEPVVPLLPDEPQGVLYVSSAGVTVRAGPSAGDRAIDEMPRGSAVVDLGGDGDGWRMILLPNGAAGYIPDTVVSLTPNQ